MKPHQLINKDGFTRVENYFFDQVMPRVTGAEWKQVCVILRTTLGSFETDAVLSTEDFMAMSGNERQAVIRALKEVRKLGAIERRVQQEGRQRSFRYRAIPHANLKEVPARQPRRQQVALPYDVLPITKYENHTPMIPSDTVENVGQDETKYENHTPSRSVKITLPMAVSEYENHTPKEASPYSVLRSRSKKRSKNAVDKTDREQRPEENLQTEPEKTDEPQVVYLCRFCTTRHEDPIKSPAVTLYRDRFKLMPSEGFRHDIWATVQDLVLWGSILDGWWYTNREGRRVERNPLGIKQMLNTYDDEIRKRAERATGSA
jgi:hypothetical protein